MLLQRLHDIGVSHVLTAPEDTAPYLTDWRGRFTGRAQAVVLPSTAGEVAAVVSACAEQRVPIVPQGGNTGLAGGATPDASGDAIVLSLKRLNRVREVDAINGAVVRHGQRLQVPTPLNHMIYHTLVVMDHYNRQLA